MKNFVLFILLSFFIEGVFGESVSVTNGDSVTLHTGLTEIQEDDVLEWRFGAGRVRIARVRKGSDPTTYDDVLDGIFRGRLKPDGQTGDLTITNITAEHAGPYKISINAIAYRTFTVIGVSGVDEEKSVSLIVGDSVTLNSGTIILRDDVIQWRFVDLNSPIAEHNRKTGNFSTSDGPDGRFRDRLHLDYLTGSLTIRNTTTEHSGVYEAGIRKSSSTHTIHKSYSVTFSGEMQSLSVKEGQSVTLHTDLTEIQTTDLMQWRFGDTVLAEINKASTRFLTSDGRFRDRLKLDNQTGSLTIMNTRFTDSGLYELQIIISRFIINKIISVTVTGEMQSVSVMKGQSVTLHTDLTEIQTTDLMQWRFGDTVLAEINKAQKRFLTSDGPDGRFKGRLKLDHQTGSLTIKNTTTEHAGLYELKIINSRFIINKRINVTVTGEMQSVSVMKGQSVTLHTDLTEIQTTDLMQWRFGDTVLAEINKASTRFLTSDVPDGRFRDRLKLDKKTGSLTIMNTRFTDSGLYELQIIISRFIINKIISVTVTDPGLSAGAIAGISVIVVLLACVTAVAGVFYYRRKISELKAWIYQWGILSVIEGETITLTPDEVHKDDELQWKFRGSCIAEQKSAADRFTVYDDLEGRLELDRHTGSLTIMNTRNADSGEYSLLITRSGKSSIKRFRVSVFDQTDDIQTVSVKKGGSVTLKTDITADIKEDGQIKWLLGYTPLAEITGGTKEFSPFADEIFQDRLELDHQTVSLTIKKIRPTDAGIYMLRKIGTVNNITELFRVEVENNPGENVPLTGVHVT